MRGRLLGTEQVVMPPFVSGGLAAGDLRAGRATLAIALELPALTASEPAHVLRFIEVNRRYGQGIGDVDADLPASLRIAPGVRFRTLDRRLGDVASSLDLDAKLTS